MCVCVCGGEGEGEEAEAFPLTARTCPALRLVSSVADPQGTWVRREACDFILPALTLVAL